MYNSSKKPSILVSITNNTVPVIGDTYSIEINENGCSVVLWANSDPSSATYAAPEYKTTEVIDTAKLLAHHMNMHTLCDHE